MKTNEETIFLNGAQGANKSVKNSSVAKKDETWKTVTVGGVSGILIGAGAIYAANAYGTNPEEAAKIDNGNEALKIAENKDDSSFADAFASAREEVGAGGVFTWNGGIYSTYTKEEWDAMTEEEKDLFAERVNPEIKAGEISTTANTAQVSEQEVSQQDTNDNDDLSGIAGHGRKTTVVYEESAEKVEDDTAKDVAANATNDDDVQIVGESKIQLEDGTIAEAVQVRTNEMDVIVVDVDGDGNPDMAYYDFDRDGKPDAVAIDTTGTGEPDVIGVDVTGNGKLDVMIADTDHNGIITEDEVYDIHTDEQIVANDQQNFSQSYEDTNIQEDPVVDVNGNITV